MLSAAACGGGCTTTSAMSCSRAAYMNQRTCSLQSRPYLCSLKFTKHNDGLAGYAFSCRGSPAGRESLL